MQLADNIMSSHTLHILCKMMMMMPSTQACDEFITNHFLFILADPPSQPVITGYTEGSVIPAGSSQKLMCMSTGGNPPAVLTWFKNDKKVIFFICY